MPSAAMNELVATSVKNAKSAAKVNAAPTVTAPTKANLGDGTATTTTANTLGADGTPIDPTTGLDTSETNALTVMNGILGQYGLQSLSSTVLGYVKQGYDSDAINVLIQQTPEWQQRFSGNTQLVKNGLAPLDPATYLATEASYAQVLSQAGLPAGFYDSTSDFANWIGNNVSPAEIQQRATDAGSLVNSQDPATLTALAEQGIGAGQVAAYFLDPTKSLPSLQNTYNAINIGTAAADQGLQINAADSQRYASMGVTQSQAQSAYSQIAQVLPGAQTLADIYHQAYGQTNLENELLGGSGMAASQRKNLVNQEEGAFSGSGGAGATLQDPGYGVATTNAGKF